MPCCPYPMFPLLGQPTGDMGHLLQLASFQECCGEVTLTPAQTEASTWGQASALQAPACKGHLAIAPRCASPRSHPHHHYPGGGLCPT